MPAPISAPGIAPMPPKAAPTSAPVPAPTPAPLDTRSFERLPHPASPSRTRTVKTCVTARLFIGNVPLGPGSIDESSYLHPLWTSSAHRDNPHEGKALPTATKPL